ncbi:MAG TPA: hypothetical protein DCM87_20420 [Planctomycetes bacterium]|nr:hypothetical protein [Planctomycetota bacterium]
MIAALSVRFENPWWLCAALIAAPAVLLAVRNLAALGPVRRAAALACRSLVIALLAALLAEPVLTERAEHVTLLAVVDHSRSVPPALREKAAAFVEAALLKKDPRDRLAVVNAAEYAVIDKMPGGGAELRRRETTLPGETTNLAAGLALAMAIAPADTAARILLVSDGNETAGDVREAARTAAANRIPIDVLPIRYRYEREVIFRRLAAPPTARSGETVALRFVLAATAPARGKLNLALNGAPVNLDPSTPEVAEPLELRAGTNVKTVSIPLGTRGLHEFKATFVPDDPDGDTLLENNEAGAVTFVAGPGHVLLADYAGERDAARPGAPLAAALREAGIDVRRIDAGAFPSRLVELLDTDCVVLADTPNDCFTHAQQEMLRQYVKELGGGLVVVGGPHAFGAGGWIGSPLAEAIPVDMDPPQKKEMPKGALVLIMHSCEMPLGNYWGEQIAAAAAGTLGSRDLAGIISYGWQTGGLWDYPLAPVGDKKSLLAAIRSMQQGDMPDFGAPMQAAHDALAACDAGQKHIIMISDSDPSPPSDELLAALKKAGITASGVAVAPHNPNDMLKLVKIARDTGGRFYHVQNANELPQIFIKEARTVTRTLIQEEAFTPALARGLGEIVRGLGAGVPRLNGYVLTGPKGGLAELLMTGPEDDPVLASSQVGLGRAAAFTSSADARWAGAWVAWGGYARFWEQVVRWTARSAQAADCEILADVEAQRATVTVEAAEVGGRFIPLEQLSAQVFTPSLQARELALVPVGPGQYRATFPTEGAGSYLIKVQYKTPEGGTGIVQSAVEVPYAPEFTALEDNMALLSALAEETGGRVVGGEAAAYDLVSRAGLNFPETAFPLTTALLIAWIALFLLDVAVRRVAVDFKALARAALAAAGRFVPGRGAKAQESIDKLVTAAAKVRAQLPRRRAAEAGRRFEAPPDAAPRRPAAAAPPPPPPPAAAKPPEKKPEKPPAPAGSLDRLLDVKRKSRTMPKDDKGPEVPRDKD